VAPPVPDARWTNQGTNIPARGRLSPATRRVTKRAFAPRRFGEDRSVAADQSAFAEANDRIRARAEEWGFRAAVPFLCECSKLSCTETMQLSLATYRRARERSHAFIVLAGHDDPQVERIVADGAGFVLVEKFT
jgi:hypothetical protein